MAKEGARVKDRGGRQGPVSYREDLGFVMENHLSPLNSFLLPPRLWPGVRVRECVVSYAAFIM